MEKAKKARNGQILSIIQWVVLLACGIFIPFWWGRMFALAMFVIHSAEAVKYGLPKGKAHGYTALESLSLTWLYGFTWWKYLGAHKKDEGQDT